jgi:hypothetical protein
MDGNSAYLIARDLNWYYLSSILLYARRTHRISHSLVDSVKIRWSPVTLGPKLAVLKEHFMPRANLDRIKSLLNIIFREELLKQV